MKSPVFPNKTTAVVSWILQVVTAILLFQTLFFKFTGHQDSVFIFEQVGIEPWGRYLSGTAELVASILLLIPFTAWLGAILAAGVILGAIGAHLFTPLGIAPTFPSVGEPDVSLFILALVVLVASLGVLFLRRQQIPVIGERFAGNRIPEDSLPVDS